MHVLREFSLSNKSASNKGHNEGWLLNTTQQDCLQDIAGRFIDLEGDSI
ncbi:3831_t:CDS:2 [Rhizophagus irregularis]|nr:3831_t:CDS:2 [Rhizophagus irregularis]